MAKFYLESIYCKVPVYPSDRTLLGISGKAPRVLMGPYQLGCDQS